MKLNKISLDYHRYPYPGKLSVNSKRPIESYRDLTLAYSPGVAAACLSISQNEEEVWNLTSRGNLVAVISNGSSVLGLGNIGSLASKPVMEGKAVLLKRLAGIDAFDIEINESNPKRFVDIVASLEPTFGAINLEDIKSPECFYIEDTLRSRMRIPVFHDDQHGTAVVTCAAIINALSIVKKDIKEVSLVVVGAGASAIASLNLLIAMGLKRKKIFVIDSLGLIYKGRSENMNQLKMAFQQETNMRTLGEVIDEADIFLGLSSGGTLPPEMLKKMSRDPIVLALANPIPEISPVLAKEVRPDAIIATGRSDFPNQVNNLLCFPFLLRGALDVRATCINTEMKMACVRTLARLARGPESSAYGYSSDDIIPKPFDPRLVVEVSLAVARAAIRTGVAKKPINPKVYRQNLTYHISGSNFFLQSIFKKARKFNHHVIYLNGEIENVLLAVQSVLDEKIARPIIIGKEKVISETLEKLGLQINSSKDFRLIDINQSDDFNKNFHLQSFSLRNKQQLSDLDFIESHETTTDFRKKRKAVLHCIRKSSYLDLIKAYENLGMERIRFYQTLNLLVKIQKEKIIFFSSPYESSKSDRILTSSTLSDFILKTVSKIRRFGITPRVILSPTLFSNFESRLYYKFNKELGDSSNRELEDSFLNSISLVKSQKPDLEIKFDKVSIERTEGRSTERFSNLDLVIMPSKMTDVLFTLSEILDDTSVAGLILQGSQGTLAVFTSQTTVPNIVNLTAMVCCLLSSKN